MKKVLLMLVVVIGYFGLTGFVNAADGFAETGNLICTLENTSLRESNLVHMSDNDKASMLGYLSEVCVKDGLTDVAVSYWDGSWGTNILICRNGYDTPKYKTGGYIGWDDLHDGFTECCPPSHPYYDAWPQSLCNDISGQTSGLDSKKRDFYTINVFDYTAIWQTKGQVVDNSYLYNAFEKEQVCSGENSAITNGVLNRNYYKKGVSSTTISFNKIECVPNGTPIIADCGDASCVAYNGGAVSSAIWDIIKNRADGAVIAEVINTCTKLPSNQIIDCQKCLLKNFGTSESNTTPYYQWSAALGCVDTRLNAFITRLIQIGMGVGSGIAVIRIIQGAFYRQSNDPSKIQEGNEILFSTFLGLGVLIGAVLILRIIGVDVLGIFTAGQFTSIINSN